MFDLIAGLVAWFYSLVPSYGFSIILLTLTVMVVVTPLTLKGTRSMLQMQLLQPELKRIQAKYGPGERQKMNEELMAFYQENGINPVGGCLPLLVQLPVFLVLFQVVRGMTRRATDMGTQLGWTTLRDLTTGPFDSETLDGSEHMFDPEYIPHSSDLYSDLTHNHEMVSFGLDLSKSASQVLGEGFIHVLPYLALILVVLFSSLYQQRQIQGRNTGATINPQQQAIMRVMPYFLPVFSWAMPAALVVYFVVSNVYRIGQQGYITRSLYHGDDSPGAQLAKSRGKSDGGKSDTGDKPIKTEGKGRPTPKRDEARGRAKGRSGRGSRSTNRSGTAGRRQSARAKGSSGRDRSDAGRAQPKESTGRSRSRFGGKRDDAGADTPTRKRPMRGSGAGRTGRAPTRHPDGSGPGSSRPKKKGT